MLTRGFAVRPLSLEGQVALLFADATAHAQPTRILSSEQPAPHTSSEFLNARNRGQSTYNAVKMVYRHTRTLYDNCVGFEQEQYTWPLPQRGKPRETGRWARVDVWHGGTAARRHGGRSGSRSTASCTRASLLLPVLELVALLGLDLEDVARLERERLVIGLELG